VAGEIIIIYFLQGGNIFSASTRPVLYLGIFIVTAVSMDRTSVEESQRFGQELINKYNSQLRDAEDYMDEDTCHNYNV
jgi:hypothetical protein